MDQMIGHVGLYVSNLKESKVFYSTLLKVMKYETILEAETYLCLGREGIPYFEIYTGQDQTSPIHIAFHCDSQKTVDQFYAIALALGAKSNGKPGYRDYLPHYYACYVRDLNGHNLEAVSLKRF